MVKPTGKYKFPYIINMLPARSGIATGSDPMLVSAPLPPWCGATHEIVMRDRLAGAVKDAMRSKDQIRLSTLRLMTAALKDQDIAKRSEDGADTLSEAEIMALFSKMVKQRAESAKAYDEAGRMELAERERTEQDIIREFLPKPLSDAEVEAAVADAIRETGASSIRDMGKVMGVLKGTYSGRMDFGTVGPRVKAALG